MKHRRRKSLYKPFLFFLLEMVLCGEILLYAYTYVAQAYIFYAWIFLTVLAWRVFKMIEIYERQGD